MDAIAKLIAYRNALDEATRDRIHSVTTVYKVVRSASDALPDRTPQRAGGGQIFGPGTTKSDSIPAWLSNKEYVIQADAVDHYGVGFFDAANAMRLAGGGSTGKGKKGPKHHGEAFGDSFFVQYQNSEAAAQAQMQAAEAAQQYYDEQARAQDRAEEAEAERIRIAEEAAQRQREIDDAILEGQTRAWDMATDAAKAQVDAAQQMVDSVEANMDRLGKAATAAFESPIFDKSSNRSGLWVGDNSAGGWRGNLEGDISGLRERSGIIAQLTDPALGLSATGLEALLGQADNAQIQQMLAAGEVDDYAALFAERERLVGSVSTQAGMAGYGQEYASATSQLVQTNQRLERIEAAIVAARPITILQTTTEEAAAAELARLLGNY